MKMMAIRNARNNNTGGSMRSGGDMRYEMNDDMRGEMESAFRDRRGRRHYDNGRFAPKSEMNDMRMDSGPYMEERRNPIGFSAGGEFEQNYRMDASHRKMNEMESKHGGMEHGQAGGKRMKLDKKMAEDWMRNLAGGAHWTLEQVKQAMKQHGIEKDPVEMWAAVNATYSDMAEVLEKFNVRDLKDYLELACAFWLEDEDAKPGKLALYYENIVK